MTMKLAARFMGRAAERDSAARGRFLLAPRVAELA